MGISSVRSEMGATRRVPGTLSATCAGITETPIPPATNIMRECFDLTCKLGPQHILKSCDESLRRLRTDYIDLYQLHRVDPQVPIEETVGAFASLVKVGKVRHIGLSECTLDELSRAHQIHPITTVQSELSLWTRDVLLEILPFCHRNEIILKGI